jgi:enoyl-CoA hydratase/carnithine racemase
MDSTMKTMQIRLNRVSHACWRVVFDNPPLNLMDPQFVLQYRDIVDAIESDEEVKVVIFESAVEKRFSQSFRFPWKTRGSNEHSSRPYWPGGVAGHPGALDACP